MSTYGEDFACGEDYQQSHGAPQEPTSACSEDFYFFSGYDCDSLAFEPVTGFLKAFLPFFAKHPHAILECRTKSANIKTLLQQQPIDNCVIAYSFTPDAISRQVEHKVPSLAKRLKAIKQLAEQGWRVGLRFDPLIYASDYQVQYKELVQQIFQHIRPEHIHSVSVGPLRFPQKMYQKLVKLYPKDKLLAHPLIKRDNHYSYHQSTEQEMKHYVRQLLKQYMAEALIFECSPL